MVSDKQGRLLGAVTGHRAVAGALAAVAGVLLLTGCAAGQHAATAQQTPVVDGVGASAGAVAVQAAAVTAPSSGTNYAAGSDAPLQLVLLNNGTADDTLVSVSSPAAKQVVLSPNGSSASAAGGGSDTGSASPAATDSASSSGSSASASDSTGSASASSAPATSGSPSASSSAAASTPIPVPANHSVPVGASASGASITLVGLTSQLFPSQNVQVTFTFASGASLTLQVPVQLTTSAPAAPTVDISPSGE